MRKYLIILIFFIGTLAGAKAEATLGKMKTATLWGRPVSYRYIPINNSTVRYDGTSYVYADKKGTRENRLVLNSAFFRKEAEQIFADFEKKPDFPPDQTVDLAEFVAVLTDAEERLKQGDGLTGEQKKILLTHLEELERQLQYSAWFPVYQSAKNKSDFIGAFAAVRAKTIEYHELSHLLDESEWADIAGRNSSLKRDDAVFWNQTEVRAFLTELAYGSNPRDSVFQTVSGAVDEIRRGRNMDFSIQKLNEVLKIVSELVGGQDGFAYLCCLTPTYARTIAQRLYTDFRMAIRLAVVRPAA